jgi:hypothetical protein
LPQILNGLNGTDPVGGVNYPYPASAQVIADTPNAWGGACENCFYETSSNHWLVANVVIDHFLNGLMKVIAAGKNAIVMNDWELDPTSRQYAIAISMLAYDPEHMWYFGNPCGQTSKVNACPEAALTFYQPYRAYPRSVSDVTLAKRRLRPRVRRLLCLGTTAGTMRGGSQPSAVLDDPVAETQ